MNAARRLWHLATRFFDVLLSRPLGPAEQDWVNGILRDREASLFWAQQIADQRHAHRVATRALSGLGANRDALAAALLHDVGKRHSRLGPIGRSLATVAGRLHLPMPGAWRLYLDHGRLGAADLRDVGAPSLAVAFAEGGAGDHAEILAILQAADDGRLKGSATPVPRNTMPPEVKS